MTALSMRTSPTAGPPWPRAIERLVIEQAAISRALAKRFAEEAR